MNENEMNVETNKEKVSTKDRFKKVIKISLKSLEVAYVTIMFVFSILICLAYSP